MKQNQTISNELLSEWIDLWQESLYRYAFYKLGNRADAEDVVQDAFLKIAYADRAIHSPKAYLFRTVANGCTDALHRKTRLQPIEERMAAPSLHDEADAIDAAFIRLWDVENYAEGKMEFLSQLRGRRADLEGLLEKA